MVTRIRDSSEKVRKFVISVSKSENVACMRRHHGENAKTSEVESLLEKCGCSMEDLSIVYILFLIVIAHDSFQNLFALLERSCVHQS